MSSYTFGRQADFLAGGGAPIILAHGRLSPQECEGSAFFLHANPLNPPPYMRPPTSYGTQPTTPGTESVGESPGTETQDCDTLDEENQDDKPQEEVRPTKRKRGRFVKNSQQAAETTLNSQASKNTAANINDPKTRAGRLKKTTSVTNPSLQKASEQTEVAVSTSQSALDKLKAAKLFKAKLHTDMAKLLSKASASQIKAAQSQYKAAEQQHQAVKDGLKAAEMDALVIEEQTKFTEMSVRIEAAYEECISTLCCEIDNLYAKLRQRDQEISELKQQIADLETRQDELKSQKLAEKDREIAALKQQLACSEMKYNELYDVHSQCQ